MFHTEDSDKPAEIDSPKLNEDGVYNLREFVNRFNLPKAIRVVEGYHGMNGAEEETIGAGEVLTLQTVKNIQKVQAESASGETFEIPLHTRIVVEKIDKRFWNQVHSLTELLCLPSDVMYVRVTQIDPHFGSEVSQGDKLKIKRNVRVEKEEFIEFWKLSKENSAKTRHRIIKLPLSCKVSFQVLNDDQEYLLSDFVKKVHFPVLAKAVDNDTNRALLKKAIQSTYFGIVKFNGVLEKSIVIGTTQEGDGVSILTIPIELDISVSQASKIETGCTNLERSKTEKLFEAIESEIYENVCEISVMRRKHSKEYVYEDMTASFGHLKQRKDNLLEIKNRNPASPNSYSPTPKGTTEKKHVEKLACGTPFELLGSDAKVKTKNSNFLGRSLSSPFVTASERSNKAISGDFSSVNLKSAPWKLDVSRDGNTEEHVYEEVKSVCPTRANHKQHEIKRCHSDVGYVTKPHKLKGGLDFQPYEDMNAITTPSQTVPVEEGLYEVVNVTAATTTSQFAQQRKKTKNNEHQELQNKKFQDYENFASLQSSLSNKAKETKITKHDNRSDSKAQMVSAFNACNRNPANSSNIRGNSAKAVQKPRLKQPPPVPLRIDSLYSKEKISVIDSSSYSQDSNEVKVTKNPLTKVMLKNSSSGPPTTLTRKFDERPATEDIKQKCEQTQDFDVDQKSKDEQHVTHIKDADPPPLPAKQRKLKTTVDDLPAKKGAVFPAFDGKNSALKRTLSQCGQPMMCSTNRLSERRGSCPETLKDNFKHGKEILRRGSETLPTRNTKETDSTISPFQLPKDLQSLNVSGVAQCLKALHMEKYVKSFKSEQIDGEMLMALDEKVLETNLGMEQLHCIKLMKFVKGWRPKE